MFHIELVKLHSLIHYYNFIFIRCHYHGSNYLPLSLWLRLFHPQRQIFVIRSELRSGMCATKQRWSFCFNGISVAKTNSRQIIMQLFFGITNYLFMMCLSVVCVYVWPRMAAIHKQLGRTKATNFSILFEFIRAYVPLWTWMICHCSLTATTGAAQAIHNVCCVFLSVARRMCIWLSSH